MMSETVLITGSTSGIGKAFANKFASEKYNLVLVSRDSIKLDKQSKILADKFGIKVFTVSKDLSDPDSANYIFELLRDKQIAIDILINNAGFNEFGNFLSTNIEKEVGMINLHIIFITKMMKLFIPNMIKNKNGYILNIGSTGSYISTPNDAVYSAIKAYILSLSKAINSELIGTGVSVTTLCPGSTNTEFAEKANIIDTI